MYQKDSAVAVPRGQGLPPKVPSHTGTEHAALPMHSCASTLRTGWGRRRHAGCVRGAHAASAPGLHACWHGRRPVAFSSARHRSTHLYVLVELQPTPQAPKQGWVMAVMVAPAAHAACAIVPFAPPTSLLSDCCAGCGAASTKAGKRRVAHGSDALQAVQPCSDGRKPVQAAERAAALSPASTHLAGAALGA